MTNSPRRAYLDANVFIAYLANESGRAPVVGSLLEDAERGSIELLTSVLSVTEVAFVASDHASGGDPTAEEDTIGEALGPRVTRQADRRIDARRRACPRHREDGTPE